MHPEMKMKMKMEMKMEMKMKMQKMKMERVVDHPAPRLEAELTTLK